MRKALTALLLGATIVATAAPALAQDRDARRIGRHLSSRVIDNDDRHDGRRRDRDRQEWLERREEWQRNRADRGRDRWEDRRDGQEGWRGESRDGWDGWRGDSRDRWEGWRGDNRDGRWQDRRDRRWEDRRDGRWEDRHDRWVDRRDRRDDRRDWWDNSWFDRRGYDYRYYGGSNWNRQWTPYGFGYHDGFTRDWVFRNFADRNRNGRIGEKEWRRAQNSFYRFADRNYDGFITRFEYDWALRELRRGYGYGYGYR